MIPETMRAARVPHHGGPEVIELVEIPTPKIRPDQVLVRVRAAGLNHLDLWVRRGIEGHPFPLPIIPCGDVAGEVAQVGDLAGSWEEGDAVIVYPGQSCGSCKACAQGAHQFCRSYGIAGESFDGGACEYVAVPACNLVCKPTEISFEEAAALPIAFLTAWTMVRRRAKVQPGEKVLVQAGGSGVGVAVIQMCQLLGAQVAATAGSPEKVAKLEQMGVDHPINYKTQDVVREVREFAGKAGVDCVFDHVGADTFPINQRVLSWGGRMILCGATTGHLVELDLRRIFFKSQSILGSTMGNRGDFMEMVGLVGKGLLGPIVDRVFPLSEIAAAQAWLEERSAFGKVVLTID